LLVPRAPDIRYDGLLPIDALCFTDQIGDTAASIAATSADLRGRGADALR
jgi:hypothetical protein